MISTISFFVKAVLSKPELYYFMNGVWVTLWQFNPEGIRNLTHPGNSDIQGFAAWKA